MAGLSDPSAFSVAASRTALPRQQTLLAAVVWSHDLLCEEERVLLRRLAVFAGGFTLDAAEEVCPGGPVSRSRVLELVTTLVDRALVVGTGNAPPFHLLETIRQFAWDRVAGAGEAEETRDSHLRFYAARSRRWFDAHSERMAFYEEIDCDHENVRAALTWAATRERVTLGLHLIARHALLRRRRRAHRAMWPSVDDAW